MAIGKFELGGARRRARALVTAGVAAFAGCADFEAAYLDANELEEELEWREFSAPSYPNATLATITAQPSAGPSPYYNGVAAATESLAADAAQKILTDGGDAIDAAVVMQAMLAVVEPQSSGLGGGGIWLIYRADKDETLIIDCRERAPKAATATMFANQSSLDLKETSGISVGVPGTLHCMTEALALKPGGLTLAQALAPAIAAAKGFPISARLASATGSAQLKKESGNAAYDEARKVFRPAGSTLTAGTTLKQPALTATLQAIAGASDPIAAFYDCAHPSGIASAIVATQLARRAGYPDGKGRMACSDLKAFKAVTDSKPLELEYHGYKVVTTPAPTSGVHLLQMLGMLDRFEIGTSPGYGFGQLNTMNVMQEAMRLAFADRAMWLGDPQFVNVPQSELLASTYLNARSALITPGKRSSSVSAGDPRVALPQQTQLDPTPGKKGGKKQGQEGADTTHFVTSDAAGNVVSVTTTISDLWGTGLMVKGRGFMLNNQLLNFNDTPTKKTKPFNPGNNDVAPFKRPRTTLAPTLVFMNGEPVAAFGSPGGSTIINTVLGFVINLIDHRMSLQEAVARPRFSLDSASSSADTEIEPGFSSSVRTSLGQLGYDLDSVSDIGAVQAVIINQFDGRKYGTADPRRIGAVAGVQ